MNGCNGLMINVARDYKNGSISKTLLVDICNDNHWKYIFDKGFGVIIFPRI